MPSLSFSAVPKGRVIPPLQPGAVRGRWTGAGICWGIVIASAIWSMFVQRGPVVCWMRLTLGIPCPTCGMTRSFCAMTRGDLLAAFHHHALGPLLFAWMILMGIVWPVEAITRKPMKWTLPLRTRRMFYLFATALGIWYACHLVQMARAGEIEQGWHASWISALLHGS